MSSPDQQAVRLGPQRGLYVGIGASAGALEALQAFFAHVPEDSGFAFIVVQHLERRITKRLFSATTFKHAAGLVYFFRKYRYITNVKKLTGSRNFGAR